MRLTIMSLSQVKHDASQKVFFLSSAGAAVEDSPRVYYSEMSDNQWDFDHTVTPEAMRGKGLARIVVEAAFAEADAKQIDYSQSSCSYVKKLLDEKKDKA